MATTVNVPTTVTKEVSKLVFDFDTMTKVRRTAKVTMPELLTDRDQLTQFSDEQILKFVNTAVARNAILTAKKEIAGASPANVWKFIASFRLLPDFAGIVAGIPETDKEKLREAKKLQTAKIFEWIKAIPPLLAQVQSLGGDDDDDEEENDSTEE